MPPLCNTLSAVVRAAAADNHYVLCFATNGPDARLGPLAEYAVRGELARLGFAGADIDVQIEHARPADTSLPLG